MNAWVVIVLLLRSLVSFLPVQRECLRALGLVTKGISYAARFISPLADYIV